MRASLAAALTGLIFLAACQQNPPPQTVAPPPAHRFTLTDQYGKGITVGQNGGMPTALYFGFAHCKDICPQTLARLGRARSKAGLTASQLRIVMVTVDPHRDTPAKLKAFIDRVGVQAYALTGSSTALHSVYRNYGVVIAPQKNDLSHTDYIYLIDAHGRLPDLASPSTPANALAEKLRKLVD